MNFPNGVGSAGAVGGLGVVVWIVLVVVYLLVLLIGLWIGYAIMRHAVTKGVLKALEKSGITSNGRVGTFTVRSEAAGTAYAAPTSVQAPPR